MKEPVLLAGPGPSGAGQDHDASVSSHAELLAAALDLEDVAARARANTNRLVAMLGGLSPGQVMRA